MRFIAVVRVQQKNKEQQCKGAQGLAVPLALAVTASLEAFALLGIFLTKVNRRSREAGGSRAQIN